MPTVNFSVPDDVKDAFNTTFEGQNKSAVIAELMREPVTRASAQIRSEGTSRLRHWRAAWPRIARRLVDSLSSLGHDWCHLFLKQIPFSVAKIRCVARR